LAGIRVLMTFSFLPVQLCDVRFARSRRRR
jgi:hypothetical protein